MSSATPSSLLSPAEQEKLIQKLQVFTIQGRDKHGQTVLRVIGKFFPARLVTVGALKKYLEEKVFQNLGDGPFSVVYVHTGVNRSENFPGMLALRSIYNAIPIKIKDNLDTVYCLHPGIQSRLFFATFGRLLFGRGLCGKLKYVDRLDLLWHNVWRKEIYIPEFVDDHDEDMDRLPMIDYGLESDHPRVFCSATSDDPELRLYSMRCIG